MQTIIDKKLSFEVMLALKKMGKIGTVTKKLNAVIAAQSHGIKKVSEVMNVSKASIYLWAK